LEELDGGGGGRTFDDVGSLLLERLDGLLLELDGVLAHQDLDVKVFVLEEFMGDDVTEATGGADEEDVLGEGHSLGVVVVVVVGGGVEVREVWLELW